MLCFLSWIFDANYRVESVEEVGYVIISDEIYEDPAQKASHRHYLHLKLRDSITFPM